MLLPSILQFSGWRVFLKGKWDTATFVTNYMPFGLFPILYITWKFKTGVPIVKAADMDFITDIDEIEADTYVFRPTSEMYQGDIYCLPDMTNLLRKTSSKLSGLGWYVLAIYLSQRQGTDKRFNRCDLGCWIYPCITANMCTIDNMMFP